MTNKEIEINNKQAKFTNGLLVAQSFQMAKMNRGLKNLSDSLLESQKISTAILEVQEDILKISSSQLQEAVKSNKLKKLEIEQNNLRYEEEKREKDYLILQRNLAFELKNSVEEIEESESSVLEKFFFLKTSEELFKELNTEKFEISEMEYCRNAFKDIQKSKRKYENLLSDRDIEDLAIIKKIEEEDENKLINKIHDELLKYASFIKLTDDLKKISQNIDRSDSSFSDLKKSKIQFSSLSRRARDFFVDFGVPEADVTTPPVDETIDAEEQREFEIFLADVGERKIDVIKAVKTITGFGLEKAKVIVDFAPASVKAGVDKDEAEQAKSLLEKAGAKVELNKII